MRIFSSLLKAQFLLLFLCLVTPYVQASSVIATLKDIESLRVNHTERFKLALNEQQARVDTFSDEEKAYFNLLMAYMYTMDKEYTLAFSYLEPLVKVEQVTVYHFRAKVLAANVYGINDDFLNAFLLMSEVNKAVESIDDADAQAQALGTIAVLYDGIGQHDISLYYSERFLNSHPKSALTCTVSTYTFHSLFSLNKLPAFFSNIDGYINFCLDEGDIVSTAYLVNKKMAALIKAQKYQEAKDVFNHYKDMIYRSESSPVIASALSHAAKADMVLGQLEQAKIKIAEALSLVKSLPISLAKIAVFEVSVDVQKQLKNYEQALSFAEQLNEFKKTYFSKKSQRRLAYHLAMAQVESSDQRVALLDKENELLTLQKKVFNQDVRLNRLRMVVIFAAIIAAGFMLYRSLSLKTRFKKISEYDELTGLSNRYHFSKKAQSALAKCAQDEKTVSVILFKLDNFKDISEQYGEQVGDWALKQLVKTCRNFMRNDDIFARLGVDEFGVILPDCNSDKAALLAEICGDAIAAIESTEIGYAFVLSSCFGVSSTDESGFVLKQLLTHADLAMYEAKQNRLGDVSVWAHQSDVN